MPTGSVEASPTITSKPDTNTRPIGIAGIRYRSHSRSRDTGCPGSDRATTVESGRVDRTAGSFTSTRSPWIRTPSTSPLRSDAIDIDISNDPISTRTPSRLHSKPSTPVRHGDTSRSRKTIDPALSGRIRFHTAANHNGTVAHKTTTDISTNQSATSSQLTTLRIRCLLLFPLIFRLSNHPRP